MRWLYFASAVLGVSVFAWIMFRVTHNPRWVELAAESLMLVLVITWANLRDTEP